MQSDAPSGGPVGSVRDDAGAPTSDSESDATPSQFAEPRRLHPASMLLGIDAGQIFQIGLFPVVALLGDGGRLLILILGAIVVTTLVGRVLDWRQRRYAFDGSELRVHSGIVGRSLRTLDVARIQQIEIRRGLIQRLLGLAVVRVETAGSASEPEVELRVVSEANAIALRTAVRAAKARIQPSSDALPQIAGEASPGSGAAESRETILTVPASHIVLASITGARLLVLPAFVAAGLQLLGEVVARLESWVIARLTEMGELTEPMLSSGPDWYWVLPLVLVMSGMLLGTAAVFGLIRDGGFTVERVDGDLHVSRGLLSTRESLIPLSRVQLVSIRANWIRRLLGFATIEIRSAGGSVGSGGSVSIPLVPVARIDGLLGEILTGMDGIPALSAHPPAARRRRVVRRVIRASLLTGLVAAGLAFGGWLGSWAVVGLATVILIAGLLGVVEYTVLAHALTDDFVISRWGGLSVTTQVSPVAKIQAVSRRSGPFQRRLDLGSVVVHVAGSAGNLRIRDAASATVADLREALTARAARVRGRRGPSASV